MLAHAQGNYEKAKWVIIGIPSELGSLSHVKYYSEGPEAIRDASYRIFSTIFGKVNLDEIYDFGDLDLEDIKNIQDLYKKIYEEVKNIYNKNKKFVFLGGDHSITYPIIKILKENWDDLYLLYFDAHPDIHPDPYVNYQSFIYYLIKEDYLDPEKIIMVGISNLSFDEKEIIKDWGIKYYTPFDVWDNPDKIAKEIKEMLNNKNVYISIDIDVFENGCGHWLEGFGIRPYHYFKIIKNIDVNLIGFDIVELFSSEICDNLAAKILLETIAIFSK
ncbi:MAG: arginase family protein [Nanopusillaceae archaeon]